MGDTNPWLVALRWSSPLKKGKRAPHEGDLAINYIWRSNRAWLWWGNFCDSSCSWSAACDEPNFNSEIVFFVTKDDGWRNRFFFGKIGVRIVEKSASVEILRRCDLLQHRTPLVSKITSEHMKKFHAKMTVQYHFNHNFMSKIIHCHPDLSPWPTSFRLPPLQRFASLQAITTPIW